MDRKTHAMDEKTVQFGRKSIYDDASRWEVELLGGGEGQGTAAYQLLGILEWMSPSNRTYGGSVF
jgi:hypothetical protein